MFWSEKTLTDDGYCGKMQKMYVKSKRLYGFSVFKPYTRTSSFVQRL